LDGRQDWKGLEYYYGVDQKKESDGREERGRRMFY
jgi:hypothetical protein